MNSMETERLLIRPWFTTDLNDLCEYSMDKRVGSMAGWKPHESIEEARIALDEYISQENHWAIVLKSENKVVEAIKLNPLHLTPDLSGVFYFLGSLIAIDTKRHFML